jgi:outer membrane biosynthesis protein TonB
VAALLKTLTFWPNKMIAEVPVEIEPDPQELAEAEPPEQEPPEPPEHQEPPDVEIEVEDVQPKRRAKAAPKKAAKAKAAPKAPAAPKPKPRKPKATIANGSAGTRSVHPSSPVAPRGRFDTFSSLEMAAELLHRRQTTAREQRRLVYKSWLE